MQGISLIVIVEDFLGQCVTEKILAVAGNYDVQSILTWDKHKIKKRISGINQSAKGHPYFVLTDQDTLDRCPVAAIKELPTTLHHNLMYRFAVMETEAWIMADRKGLAKFLSVRASSVPENPDSVEYPKEEIINLAKMSNSGKIKQGLVPQTGSLSKVGRDYNNALGEFVLEKWNINEASQCSPSLNRTMQRLQRFVPI